MNDYKKQVLEDIRDWANEGNADGLNIDGVRAAFRIQRGATLSLEMRAEATTATLIKLKSKFKIADSYSMKPLSAI